MIDYDYHTHSMYSDGRFLRQMLQAASTAGLAGIGITDHCTVSDRAVMVEHRDSLGFSLDITYERRRAAIERFREVFDIDVYDGVEMDYDPRDESQIETFLETADFQYTIGSVHLLDGVHVQYEPYFADKSEPERERLVETYFEKLIALIDSELFDVAAHLDLVERNPALRGFATESQYRRVAAAIDRSRTITELNAGRLLADFGSVHPVSPFFEILREHGVSFTVGTDSHTPTELTDRIPAVADEFDACGLEPAELSIESR